MSLLSKKKKPSEEDLISLRKEIESYKSIEDDFNSPQIKRLIDILIETRENTIKIFESTDIESFENETKMIFFLASIRSKLQVIDAIKRKYIEAKSEKEKLLEEYNKIVQE